MDFKKLIGGRQFWTIIAVLAILLGALLLLAKPQDKSEPAPAPAAPAPADAAGPLVERGESEDRSTAPNMLIIRVLPGRCPICARRRPGDAENGRIAKAWL